MSAHTPGPWTCNYRGEIKDARGRFVAVVGRVAKNADENVSNGLLVAAAPELLTRLRALVEMEDRFVQESGVPLKDGVSDEVELSRSLLAKIDKEAP